MTNAQSIIQRREVDLAALITLRIDGTSTVFRFQNWLTDTYTFQGISYYTLAFDLQSSAAGRGLVNKNVSYTLEIPEQLRFSVKRSAVLYDGLRNSLVAVSFVFPGETDAGGSDIEPIRHQRFKVRSSIISNSVMSLELDSLTDANFSAIGNLVPFPTFRRQHHVQRDSHYGRIR